MLLEDGTGSGRTVKIDEENRMTVMATTEVEAAHVNNDEGEAYTLFSPILSDDLDPSLELESPCIFYIKNTSEKNLVITSVRMWAETAEYLDIYFNQEGVPVGGHLATPVNMNLNSGKQAAGVFLGSDRITGMSGGTWFDRMRIPADDGDHIFEWEPTIIIPKNNVLTVYAGIGGILTEASVTFYYHD